MVDAINDLDDMLDNVDENGKHKAVLSGIRFSEGRDGRNWLIFKFEVSDSESPLDGEEYERWTQDWSHITRDDYDAMSGKEKSQVRTAKKRVLENLINCGFSEDEAKEIRKNPKSELRANAKGNPVWITVSVRESDKGEFKNITQIQVRTDEDESGSDFSQVPF